MHDVATVYVVDGSSFTSATDYLADQMKQGVL
jgi:hypothetical protein